MQCQPAGSANRLGALCAGMVVAVTFALCAPVVQAREDFPEPEGIQPAVAFWMRVYLEASTDGGFVHDADHLGIVYETVQLNGAKGRTKSRLIKRRKQHWRSVLRRLASGAGPRNDAEAQLMQTFERALGRRANARDFREAANNIRFQLGQRNKFRDGLIRSGAYEDAMRDVFRRAGLPEDLAYLPHVESSFNVRAYSKYGAAGAWQFMRSTGRLFMKVDYVVDERLDPMTSTRAAADLLGQNYAALGSWPLALTAYNHGRAGMLRAKERHGTDIVKIIHSYRSRTFGFASRNFYAQFLAARKIVRNYQSYFGPLEREKPEPIDEVTLPFYADIQDIQRHLGVPPDVVKRYNPALRPPVFRSDKRIPKGYTLRLPAGTATSDSNRWLAAVPAELRYPEQRRSEYYRVRRGDTLSAIARRNSTSIRALVAANNLRSRHRIYPGQVLQLPNASRSRKTAPPSFALVKSANAATPEAPRRKPARIAKRAAVPEPPAPKPEPRAETPPDTQKSGETRLVANASQPVPAGTEPARRHRVRNMSITVDALETLGHYAEWLEIPTQRLRSLNSIRYGRTLHMGQRIKLDFSKVSPETFVQRRTEFHKGIEEDFFGSFQVVGVVEHRVRRGETIWAIANRTYGVPTWLVHRYNPDTNLARLTPGGKLTIPVVESLN